MRKSPRNGFGKGHGHHALEDKQVLEKTIFILARANILAGFVKDQEARSSFAGFGKDHHAVCKKSEYAATKILIGS